MEDKNKTQEIVKIYEKKIFELTNAYNNKIKLFEEKLNNFKKENQDLKKKLEIKMSQLNNENLCSLLNEVKERNEFLNKLEKTLANNGKSIPSLKNYFKPLQEKRK